MLVHPKLDTRRAGACRAHEKGPTNRDHRSPAWVRHKSGHGRTMTSPYESAAEPRGEVGSPATVEDNRLLGCLSLIMFDDGRSICSFATSGTIAARRRLSLIGGRPNASFATSEDVAAHRSLFMFNDGRPIVHFATMALVAARRRLSLICREPSTPRTIEHLRSYVGSGIPAAGLYLPQVSTQVFRVESRGADRHKIDSVTSEHDSSLPRACRDQRYQTPWQTQSTQTSILLRLGGALGVTAGRDRHPLIMFDDGRPITAVATTRNFAARRRYTQWIHHV